MSENSNKDNDDIKIDASFIEENNDIGLDDLDGNFLNDDPLIEDDFENETYDDNDDFDTAFEEKSSPNWMNIGIIGGVVIVIIIIIYFLFFSGSKTPTPQQITESRTVEQTTESIPEQTETKSLEDQIIDGGGLLANLNLLQDERNIQNLENQDDAKDDMFIDVDEITPEPTSAELDDLFNAVQNIGEEQIPSAPDVQNTEQILPVPMDSDIQNTSDMVAAIDSNAPDDIFEEFIDTPLNENSDGDDFAEQDGSETLQNEIIGLNAQVKMLTIELEDSLNRIEELSKQNEIKSEPEVIAQSNDAEVQELKSQISKLEKEISTLKSANTRPVVNTPKRRTTPKRTAPKPIVKWDLRGASRGQAVIAKSGTENLRTVNIGDNIEGLGQIQSINVENGRWVVRGTQGRVTQ